MLSSRPAEEYVWSASKTYNYYDVAWYNGVWYMYLPNSFGGTVTNPPNIDTNTYVWSDSTNRTLRSWLIIDPRTLPYPLDPDSQKDNTTASGNAERIAAALRQIPYLSIYDAFQGSRPCYSNGVVAGSALSKISYYEAGTYALKTNFKTCEYGYPVGYGECIEMYSGDGITSTGPTYPFFPSRVDSGSGYYFSYNEALVNEYLLTQSNFTASLTYDDAAYRTNAINSAKLPNNAEFYLPYSTDTTFHFADTTLSIDISSDTGNTYSPTTIFYMGRAVDLSLEVLVQEYALYTYPGAYLTDPDRQAWGPSGGAVTLISGDGVTTGRSYKIVGPFSSPTWVILDSSTHTISSSYETVVTTSLSGTTGEPYKIKGGYVFYKYQDTSFL